MLTRLCLLLALSLWTASAAFSICNDGPSAVSDTVTAKAGELIFIDVLANDHHPQGLPLSIRPPTKGSCSGSVSRDTSLQLVSYAASPGASGSCSFNYTVEDSVGGSSTAAVTVHFIEPGDEAPVVGPALPVLASAAEGVGLDISVSVPSLPTPTYQWSYSATGEPEDFEPILLSNARYSGSQTHVLRIVAASAADEGWYQLEVTDSTGVVPYPGYSEPARLVVFPAFTVTTDSPELQTVPEASSVGWSVQTVGGAPEPSVVWQFCRESTGCEGGFGYSDLAEGSSAHTGQRDTDLQVLAADADDQGWYRAVVSDGGLPEAAVVVSTAFHLRVVEPAGPGIAGPKPAEAMLADNCLVTFTTKVVGAETPPSFQWEIGALSDSWEDVVDGGPFSGATTTQLSVDTSDPSLQAGRTISANLFSGNVFFKTFYRLRVDVDGVSFYSDTSVLTVNIGQVPFNGIDPLPPPTPIGGSSVPIEMEHYDALGPYIDFSVLNLGDSNFRADEPVDLSVCDFPVAPDQGNPVCVDNIMSGEALAYTLSIEDEGFYELSYRYESPVANQSVIASFDDQVLSEVVTADTGASSGVMKTDRVYLEKPPWTCGGKATRILTVDFQGGGFKMNRLRFTKQQAPLQRPFAGVGQPAALPGVLEAEEFDVVDDAIGQTVAYKDLDSGNNSASSCNRDAADPEWVECGFISDGTSAVRQGVELEDEEWLEYSVAVTEPGWYVVAFDYIERTTAFPEVRLTLDGGPFQTVSLPPTNGEWLSYRAPIMRLQTATGVLRLEVEGAPIALDRVEFERIPNAPPSAGFDVFCQAARCTFTSTSTDDHGITGWAWRVDGQDLDPNTPVLIHDFATGGTKDVRLTVTDSDFDTGTAQRQIVVNALPVARFTSACDGLLCSFDASGSSDEVGVQSYQWTFQNGAQAASITTVSPIVSYQYPTKGLYRVDLVVSDGEWASSATDSNTEPDDYPAAAFSFECDHFECVFDAGSSSDDGALVSYRWDFGDGTAPVTTSLPSNVEHTYDGNDDYTVSLTVTDDAPAGGPRGAFIPGGPQTASTTRTVKVQGVSETVSKILPILFKSGSRSVDKPPSAHLEVSCVGLNCTLDASRSRDDRRLVSYLWDFGDGSGPLSTSSSVKQHTYAVDGTFSASVTVSDGRQEATALATVMPNQLPVAAFTWQCTGLSCDLDASGSSSDTISFAWQFGDGGTQTASGSGATQHVYASGGDYTVTLTVADEVQSAVTSRAVSVDAPPVAAFEVSCSILDCTFDASDSSDDRGIASYAWSFGDGSSETSSTATIQHAYSQGGPYTVSLTVTDSGQQPSQTSQSFSLDGPPVAFFTADCDGASCSFDASGSSDDVGIHSYDWDFGDGSAIQTAVPTVQHVYSESLGFTVTLTVSDGAQSDQASLTVEVDEPPVPAFTVRCRALRCTFDASGSEDDRGIATYSWDFGDGVVLDDDVEATIEHVYSTKGSYEVTLEVTDTGSQAESTTQTVRPRSRRSGMRPVFKILPFLAQLNKSTLTEALEVQCAGLVCSFSVTGVSAKSEGVSYLWSFGDGVVAVTEESTVGHTFLLSGDYSADVIVLYEGVATRQHERKVTVDAFEMSRPRSEDR